MTLWELGAAIDGWMDAHVPPDQRGPSEDERDDVIDFLEEFKARHGD